MIRSEVGPTLPNLPVSNCSCACGLLDDGCFDFSCDMHSDVLISPICLWWQCGLLCRICMHSPAFLILELALMLCFTDFPEAIPILVSCLLHQTYVVASSIPRQLGFCWDREETLAWVQQNEGFCACGESFTGRLLARKYVCSEQWLPAAHVMMKSTTTGFDSATAFAFSPGCVVILFLLAGLHIILSLDLNVWPHASLYADIPWLYLWRSSTFSW